MPETAKAGRPRELRWTPGTISALYAAAGTLWIFASDILAERASFGTAALSRLQSAKGFLFVLGTAAILYGLLRRDAKARMRFETELARRNSQLRAIAAAQALFVSAGTEEQLLQGVCRIIVEEGGYRLAWVGLAEPGPEKRVRPVAAAGVAVGYLEALDIRWSDTAQGRGPTGTAIRTGEPVTLHDLCRHAHYHLWREQAERLGFHASIALPLVVNGRPIGALSIYSGEPQAFSPDEAAILSAFAGTLSAGIARLRAIDELARGEKALRESEELLRKVLEVLPVGVWIAGRDGTILHGNPAGQAIWRGARFVDIERYGEYRGWWHDTGTRIAPEEWALARALRTGETSINEVVDIECFDGSRKTILNSAVPLRGADGAITGAIVTNLDVTELKRVEKELRDLSASLERKVAERTAAIEERAREIERLNERLAASNRELEAFSYSVSHDLRAPLRAIDGFSQALLEDCADRLDDTGKDHLRRIRAAAARMGALIEDMLELSRVARTELGVRRVDLSAVAREIANELAQKDPARNVEFLIAKGLAADGDEKLLRIALSNLLENAWKFTSQVPKARIEVGARRGPDGPIYFVRDNGAGLDMKYAEKLFAPFQRLHAAQDFPGTGVGLATVQRIVHRHGGRIWVESAPGRGAAFHFTLGAGGGILSAKGASP